MTKDIKNFIYIITLMIIFVGCGGGGGGSSESVVNPTTASGTSTKGPFKKGSKVVAYKLVNGVRDISYETNTTDDKGTYSINTSWSGPTEIEITGDYYNEADGNYTADGNVTAVVNMVAQTASSFNVNVLTHIATPLIKAKLAAGTKIDTAKQEAKEVVKVAFNLKLNTNTELEDLDLTTDTGENIEANTQLLEISTVIMKDNNATGLIKKLQNDIENNTSTADIGQIKAKALDVNLTKVSNQMQSKISGVNPPTRNIITLYDETVDANIAFDEITDVNISTIYTSSTITISGLEANVSVSISEGSFSINGAAYNTTGNIKDNDTVVVKASSDGSYETEKIVNLRVGDSTIALKIKTKYVDESSHGDIGESTNIDANSTNTGTTNNSGSTDSSTNGTTNNSDSTNGSSTNGTTNNSGSTSGSTNNGSGSTPPLARTIPFPTMPTNIVLDKKYIPPQ